MGQAAHDNLPTAEKVCVHACVRAYVRVVQGRAMYPLPAAKTQLGFHPGRRKNSRAPGGS